jgi:hypothetical protein
MLRNTCGLIRWGNLRNHPWGHIGTDVFVTSRSGILLLWWCHPDRDKPWSPSGRLNKHQKISQQGRRAKQSINKRNYCLGTQTYTSKEKQYSTNGKQIQMPLKGEDLLWVVVVEACNRRTLEAEAEGSRVQGHSGLHNDIVSRRKGGGRQPSDYHFLSVARVKQIWTLELAPYPISRTLTFLKRLWWGVCSLFLLCLNVTS